jgi:hypothetical protein
MSQEAYNEWKTTIQDRVRRLQAQLYYGHQHREMLQHPSVVSVSSDTAWMDQVRFDLRSEDELNAST